MPHEREPYRDKKPPPPPSSQSYNLLGLELESSSSPYTDNNNNAKDSSSSPLSSSETEPVPNKNKRNKKSSANNRHNTPPSPTPAPTRDMLGLEHHYPPSSPSNLPLFSTQPPPPSNLELLLLSFPLFFTLCGFWLLDSVKDPLFALLQTPPPLDFIQRSLQTPANDLDNVLWSSSYPYNHNLLAPTNTHPGPTPMSHQPLAKIISLFVTTALCLLYSSFLSSSTSIKKWKIFIIMGLPYTLIFFFLGWAFNAREGVNDCGNWFLPTGIDSGSVNGKFYYYHPYLAYACFVLTESYASLIVAHYWGYANSRLGLSHDAHSDADASTNSADENRDNCKDNPSYSDNPSNSEGETNRNLTPTPTPTKRHSTSNTPEGASYGKIISFSQLGAILGGSLATTAKATTTTADALSSSGRSIGDLYVLCGVMTLGMMGSVCAYVYYYGGFTGDYNSLSNGSSSSSDKLGITESSDDYEKDESQENVKLILKQVDSRGRTNKSTSSSKQKSSSHSRSLPIYRRLTNNLRKRIVACIKPFSGLLLILTNKYLFLLLLTSSLYEITLTILDYSLKLLSIEKFTSDVDVDVEATTTFIGHYAQLTNLLSLLSSLFLFPYLTKHYPLSRVLLVYPTLLILLSLLSFTNPSITTLFTTMSILKGLTYSLMEPSKELLYLPLPPQHKYTSKAYIDIVGSRGAKALGSIITHSARGEKKEVFRVGGVWGVGCSCVLLGVVGVIGGMFSEAEEFGGGVLGFAKENDEGGQSEKELLFDYGEERGEGEEEDNVCYSEEGGVIGGGVEMIDV